jgi:phosphoglycolate phosphatase-like HAD superfamily hydrolase
MIKVVIFDFDGVLFESVAVKTEAFRQMFLPYGDEVARRVVAQHLAHGGMTRYEKLKIYHEEFLQEQVTPDFLEQRAQEFSRLVVDQVVASAWVAGAREFLEANQGEYDFFVVSATPEAEIRDIVARKAIGRFFREILGAPRSKGENVRIILEKYGYQAPEVVFVGDAMSDYEGARQNGIGFVGRGDLFRQRGVQVVAIPDLTSLDQALLQAVQG